MALDENCKDKSYLFGRLLAVADVAEDSTYEKDEKRVTNARRYFEAFTNHPSTTWDIIYKRLAPYLEKNYGFYYRNLIDEIVDMFERDDFSDNTKLDPVFLHGYCCQRTALYKKKNSDENK